MKQEFTFSNKNLQEDNDKLTKSNSDHEKNINALQKEINEL